MGKATIFSVLCFCLLFNLCHENKTYRASTVDHQTFGNIESIRLLKSVTTFDDSITYFYDTTGLLIKKETASRSHDSSVPQIETYEYNDSGKMIKSISKQFTHYYLYTQDNQLLQHSRVDSTGKRDSVTFTFHNNEVTGSWNKIIYCYENNRLQKIFNESYGGPKGQEKGITAYYTFGSKRDKAYASLLKSIDILTLADFGSVNNWYFGFCEITGYEKRASDCSFIPLIFKRIYDNENYPIKLQIYSITGHEAETAISYYYYPSN